MKRSASRESKREGSSSFLKKTTKKHLLSVANIDLACRISQQSKSFSGSFFQKNCFLACLRWKMSDSFV
jgi:hypothetical protein